MLTSSTKRKVTGSRVPSSLDADKTVTGGEAEPNLHGTYVERDKPIMLLFTGRDIARSPDGMIGKG